ncbi:alpha/beta-hydrolase [Colletotrichum zoysiae]|uniref:Alpha/beta-hydrolase n=1 Tax=Colletotrichum zoysiae TaxID=1216348 RepID=A0AAD9H6H0_9PEZI|nr:alpha/beta-hydrolase [Colletotrichum zoysiae]
MHGFPNLSYNWRFMMPKLAEAGYYAVAFDMRGFGRTHNADLSPISESSFRPMTALRDVVTLVRALGYEAIHTLVGHDLGAFVASLCGVARGDMIKSLVLMSHPFKGCSRLPFGTAVSPLLASAASNGTKSGKGEGNMADPDIRSSLLKLDPPRKHYKYYNASPEAAEEWTHPAGEPMHRFLRGYFHLKSAAYSLNKPRPLASWTAEQLAVMPHYYILDRLGDTRWLTDADLQVYTDEFSRNTFGPSLLWYKVLVDPGLSADLLCFAGTKIGVPTKYVSGTSDWGTYQVPGSLDGMENGESKPEESVKEILELARSV